MENKDLDFLIDKINEENIKAPDSLNEESVLKLLEGNTPKRIKLYNKKGFKAFVSAVACLAIIVTSLSVAIPISNYVKTPKTVVAKGDVLDSFKSYDDIKKAIEKNHKEEIGLLGYVEKSDSALNESAADMATGQQEYTSSSYSPSNVQVNGVDEADEIKNDGRYIYCIDYAGNTIKIYEPKNENTNLVSVIDDFKFTLDDYGWIDNEANCIIEEMFVYNNKLIVNGVERIVKNDEGIYYYDESSMVTLTYIYDITDIKNPKLIRSFSQDGYCCNSRLIDGQLYIVSNKIDWDNADYKISKDYAPKCGVDGEKSTILPNDIAYIENGSTNGFVVISSINVDTCEKTAKTRAIYGCTTTLYCSRDNMYIAIGYWDNDLYKTEIVKVKLGEDKISFPAKVTVNGQINDQFSMDENNGYFRVSYSNDNKNYVAVYDEGLNLVGKTKGFAADEEIESTRFMGDYAYVITFENTDPLFVIDLSNPSAPEIKGSVEITGFSSQLTPVDENTLLGIGYISQWENENWVDGIKLVLFDVSNRERPKVLDSQKLYNYQSAAQSNHLAITIDKINGRYAIDFLKYSEEDNECGAFTFEIKDNKIETTNKFFIKNNTDCLCRCSFLNDYLYVVDYNGNLNVFKY